MAKPLPYLNGKRNCFPCKCVMFFNLEKAERSVAVLFTNNKDERINSEQEPHPDWLIKAVPEESLLKKATSRIEAAGYELSVRKQLPTCISFNLTPLKPSKQKPTLN